MRLFGTGIFRSVIIMSSDHKVAGGKGAPAGRGRTGGTPCRCGAPLGLQTKWLDRARRHEKPSLVRSCFRLTARATCPDRPVACALPNHLRAHTTRGPSARTAALISLVDEFKAHVGLHAFIDTIWRLWNLSTLPLKMRNAAHHRNSMS